MTIRFFILQAHYRSTVDFSNEALQAAEKGLKKLFAGYETLKKMMPAGDFPPQEEGRIGAIRKDCYAAMNDDFNSPIVIANLFECVRIINSAADKKEMVSPSELVQMKEIFDAFLFDILGLKDDKISDNHELLDGLMELILSIRQKSRENKDWGTSDQIRDTLQKLKISIKDGKEGSNWSAD